MDCFYKPNILNNTQLTWLYTEWQMMKEEGLPCAEIMQAWKNASYAIYDASRRGITQTCVDSQSPHVTGETTFVIWKHNAGASASNVDVTSNIVSTSTSNVEMPHNWMHPAHGPSVFFTRYVSKLLHTFST